MAVDIVVYAQDTAKSLKGEFGTARTSPRGWGNRIALPDMIRLTVNGVTLEQVIPYTEPWMFEVDYEVLNHNLVLDGYRIKVFSMWPNVSGQNVLTRNMIENFLNNYNMVFVSASANDIRFDFGVYQTSISEGILSIPVGALSQIIFSETGYDSSTGIHTVRADYSATGIEEAKAARTIEGIPATVLTNENGIITYEFNRSVITQEIKYTFADKINHRFQRRRYYVQESMVDDWVTAGGVVTVNKNIMLNNLVDKLTE